MSIIMYAKNIFTHGGQTDVKGFVGEITEAKEFIAAAEGLIVFAGVHGNEDGTFNRNFDEEELEMTQKVADTFENVKLVLIKDKVLTKEEMTEACKEGAAFFTWCDSEATRERYEIDLGKGKLVAE